MQCVQSRKSQVLDVNCELVIGSASCELRHPLKSDYVRKIVADACMVGSMPTPQSSRLPLGLICPTEFFNCTYTTNSGFGGMRTYPYSDYRLWIHSAHSSTEGHYSINSASGDCPVDLRRGQQPSKHPSHPCCACIKAPPQSQVHSSQSLVLHSLPVQARQSTSVTAVPRQHPQQHVRQTSVGASKVNEVVLRQHPALPHHSQRLSRRDRALMTTSMLVTVPHNASSAGPVLQQPRHPSHVLIGFSHQQNPHYNQLYRQSMPPVLAGPHQRVQMAPNVYAAVYIR